MGCLASERGGGAKMQKKHCLIYIKTSLDEAEVYLNSRDRKDGFGLATIGLSIIVNSLYT